MSTVELTRDYDGPDLIAALAEHGLVGELDDWLRDRGLSLVPVRIDDCTYALSPPAG